MGQTLDCFCKSIEFTLSHRLEEAIPDSYDKCASGFRGLKLHVENERDDDSKKTKHFCLSFKNISAYVSSDLLGLLYIFPAWNTDVVDKTWDFDSFSSYCITSLRRRVAIPAA